MAFTDLDIDWEYLLERIERFLDLGEEYLTRKLADYQAEPQIFQDSLVFRWVRSYQTGYFEEVSSPDLPDHADLVGIDGALERLSRNTDQFVHDLPSNHVLILGNPGNGKRSAIKGLLSKFGNQGLRLIEIHREDLHLLSEIIFHLRPIPFHFILLCSDLTGNMDDAALRELKNLVQGGIETRARNVLLYATASVEKNRGSKRATGSPDCIHNSFGLSIEIPPMKQTTYLDICRQLAQQRTLPITEEALKQQALAWAKSRRHYSGLMAGQFIDDLAGQWLLEKKYPSRPS